MSKMLLAAAVAVLAAGLVAAAVVTTPDNTADVAIDVADAPADSDDGGAVAGTDQAGDDAAADAPAADTGEAAIAAAAELEDLGPRMELTDIDGWLQSPEGTDSLGDLIDGKVSVVQIWTFGCFNCKNTLPNLTGLRDAYAENDDFQIVGIHSPEFEHEEDPDNIQAAADDLDVTWPIALDTRQTNFFDWQGSRGFWPRTYVIDQDGNVRFDHIGEGAYDELNQTVATLLEAADQQAR